MTPREIIAQALFRYGFHAAKSTLADAIVDAVQAIASEFALDLKEGTDAGE